MNTEPSASEWDESQPGENRHDDSIEQSLDEVKT